MDIFVGGCFSVFHVKPRCEALLSAGCSLTSTGHMLMKLALGKGGCKPESPEMGTGMAVPGPKRSLT